MSALTPMRLTHIRERTERRWAEQQEDRRHHIDPTAADVAVALSDVDYLLEHIDHLTTETTRLREGIEAIRKKCSMPKSWLDTYAASLLSPPTE